MAGPAGLVLGASMEAAFGSGLHISCQVCQSPIYDRPPHVGGNSVQSAGRYWVLCGIQVRLKPTTLTQNKLIVRLP